MCIYRLRVRRHHKNHKTSHHAVPRIVMYSYLKMCMQMWDGGPVGLRSFVERLTTCSSALFKIRQALSIALNMILMIESDFQERQVQLQGGTKIWPRTERMQTVGVQATRTPSGTIRIRKQTATVHSMGWSQWNPWHLACHQDILVYEIARTNEYSYYVEGSEIW